MSTFGERLPRLEAAVVELRAMAEQVSEQADRTYNRNLRALALVAELVTLPEQRPDAWETPHVEALEERLTAILDALTGADTQDD